MPSTPTPRAPALLRATALWLCLVPIGSATAAHAQGPTRAATIGALNVPGYRAAVLVEPRGPGPKPTIVVLHGMGDSPDSLCAAFERLVEGRAWILCPRGVPFPGYDDAWTFPLARGAVLREIRAGLQALASAQGARVDVATPVLAGFSLGAMFASFVAAASPAAFPRAFILDTHHVWSRTQIRRFADQRGRAVSFVCTRTYLRDCGRLAPVSGVVPDVATQTRTLLLPSREHGYDAQFIELIRADFEALVATDPRWRR